MRVNVIAARSVTWPWNWQILMMASSKFNCFLEQSFSMILSFQKWIWSYYTCKCMKYCFFITFEKIRHQIFLMHLRKLFCLWNYQLLSTYFQLFKRLQKNVVIWHLSDLTPITRIIMSYKIFNRTMDTSFWVMLNKYEASNNFNVAFEKISLPKNFKVSYQTNNLLC